MKSEEFINALASILEFDDDSVTVDTNLADYWDSLQQIEVLAMLEEQFGVVLEMDQLADIKKVQDIVNILTQIMH